MEAFYSDILYTLILFSCKRLNVLVRASNSCFWSFNRNRAVEGINLLMATQKSWNVPRSGDLKQKMARVIKLLSFSLTPSCLMSFSFHGYFPFAKIWINTAQAFGNLKLYQLLTPPSRMLCCVSYN